MMNANIEKILGLMQADDSIDAPEDSIKWAKSLLRTHVQARPTLVERIFAVLQMDIQVNDPILGERSAAAASSRQMLFTAGNIAVDLRISHNRRGFAIKGQLLGDELSNAAIDLSSDKAHYQSKSDEDAEFTFEKVTSGNYSMTVTVAGKVIVMEGIQIP